MKEFEVKEIRYIPSGGGIEDSIWKEMQKMGITIKPSTEFTCMLYEEKGLLIIAEPLFRGKNNENNEAN